MGKPLEITFHGPFVFRFASKNAWAYAPKCDEHYLNILTDTEDVTLPIDKETNERIRTFELTGPTPGKTVSKSNCLIITYPWNKTWPDTERHWNYVLSFPAPDYIYGLVPEYVWIYGYPNLGKAPDPSKPEESYYARALRFRYKDSLTPRSLTSSRKIKSPPNTLAAPTPITLLKYAIPIITAWPVKKRSILPMPRAALKACGRSFGLAIRGRLFLERILPSLECVQQSLCLLWQEAPMGLMTAVPQSWPWRTAYHYNEERGHRTHADNPMIGCRRYFLAKRALI